MDLEHEVGPAAESESIGSAVSRARVDNTLTIRFSRENGASPKSPVFAYHISLTGPLAGASLVGKIFKSAKDGQYEVAVPGGRNFGGCFVASMRTAKVNGRTIAVAGEYDENGIRLFNGWESMIKTALLTYLNDPAKSVQSIRVA